MTVDEVRARVEQIRQVLRDDEEAHMGEDALWRDVLDAIASGDHPEGQAPFLAREALATTSLDFARWYA